MRKIKKHLLKIEVGFYGVLCAVFIAMSFFEFSKKVATAVYAVTLALTFGYFFLLETLLQKYDAAIHRKVKKDFYKPTAKAKVAPVKRKGIGGVIILWIVYLSVIAALKFCDALPWQMFCCGGSFMFLLNSLFARKKCMLSVWFLHNKNNCCKHCGINGWDGAIFASALIFAPYISVFTTVLNWVIIFASLAKLIEWEYVYHKYPERFYPETNANLSCKGCAKKAQCIKAASKKAEICVKTVAVDPQRTKI